MNPPGSDAFSGSSYKGYWYNVGSIVTLTEDMVTGYNFQYWGEDVSAGPGPISVTMNGVKTVTAYYSSPSQTGASAPLILLDVQVGYATFTPGAGNVRIDMTINSGVDNIPITSVIKEFNGQGQLIATSQRYVNTIASSPTLISITLPESSGTHRFAIEITYKTPNVLIEMRPYTITMNVL